MVAGPICDARRGGGGNGNHSKQKTVRTSHIASSSLVGSDWSSLPQFLCCYHTNTILFTRYKFGVLYFGKNIPKCVILQSTIPLFNLELCGFFLSCKSLLHLYSIMDESLILIMFYYIFTG